MKSPIKINKAKLWILLMWVAQNGLAAPSTMLNLSYSNNNFNATQPGWSDSLTLYNNSNTPITITQLQFETNYAGLDTSQLYGSIQHPAQPAVPVKINDFDYQYSFSTESPWTPGQYTVIPAHSSVNLTGIPLSHTQASQNGIPVYFQPPFNIKVILQGGTTVSVPLQRQCQNQACHDPGRGKIIGAYFTDWANYHYTNAPSNMLMPNQIPLNNLNTVFYDVGKIDPTSGEVNFDDINHDQYYIPAFAILKQQYPYLNLVDSFGGWGDAGVQSYPSYDLAMIFDQQNPTFIQTLADHMVNTIREIGFNGIDIDYEWNAIQPNGGNMTLTQARALGFQELLQDIRADFNKIQPKNNPHYYKLTVAVFAGKNSITSFAQWGSWKTVAQAVDNLDIMSYDMHGQFDTANLPPDNITGFLSNMQNSHSYQNPDFNQYDVVDAVHNYEAQGVAPNKIVIGIPAYTRMEKTAVPITSSNMGAYLTLAPVNEQPAGEAGPGDGGIVDYKCLLHSHYCWNNFQIPASSAYMEANLSGKGLFSLEQTPIVYDTVNNYFMTFDDGLSSFNKAQWAKQQDLAGLMVWEIDGDIPASDSKYSKNSIIFNIWKGLSI